jgi:hypothetical protein
LVLASCSGRPKLQKVSGKVLVDGEPAQGAIVTLHPIDEVNANAKILPTGVVGLDGVFQLTTYKDGDGAPQGKYQVTISWTKTEKELDPESDERGEVLMIPTRYTVASKSGLTAEVSGSTTELKPFQLTANEDDEPAAPGKSQ